MDLMRKDETLEALHGGLAILQKKRGFRFGMDAVLLAGHAGPRQGDVMCDLGTGSGIVPLLLAGSGATRIWGLELQQPYADMAARSVALNGLDRRVEILQGDLRNIRELLPAAGCNLVTCNPPYRKTGAGRDSGNPELDIARSELACTIGEVCGAAAWLLPTGGRFVAVYRPDRLADLLEALRQNGLEPKRLRFVQKTVDSSPTLLLAEAVRGAQSGLLVTPPLLLQNSHAGESDALRRIYKGEQAWT